MMELNTISHPPKPSSFSVELKHVYKRYSADIVVLRGLNMKVPQGNIYALLGSSGCGKSTLLNCLTGLCMIDSGIIKLNVERRSYIGFMPQNTCLYKELSIYENMLIFGYLNGMTKEKVLTRAKKFINHFELPPGDRLIETLSGGQQRRVSMIIAFLHEPPIVLLDEPTVGVDVNLTQLIWDYYVQQANSGQTIIITTHYIQEAYRAHKIGMLRSGILIAEENPQTLMERYDTDSLENVFLQLSEKQQQTKSRYLSRKESRFPSDRSSRKKPFFEDDNKIISAKRMKSVLYKNVLQLTRNYVPSSKNVNISTALTLTAGLPKKLKIGFVDEEISIHDCNNAYSSGCILSDEDFRLSCIYVNLFRNRTYRLNEYQDVSAAIRAVNENDVWAAIHFVKEYTSLTRTVFRRNKTEIESALNSLTVNIYMDPSSYVSTFVKREILQYFRDHWHIALEQCGVSSRMLINYPGALSFQTPLNVAGDSESATMSSALPGMLVTTCICLASTSVAMIGTEEKLSGTIPRMQAAGISFESLPSYSLSVILLGLSLYEFLISTFIVHFIMHITRVVSLIVVAYWILDYPEEGSMVLLTFMLILLGLVGSLFGIVFSVITTNPTVTTIVQFGFLYFASFAAGLLWPIQGQKAALRFLNKFLPFAWPAQAIQGISIQALTADNDIVFRGFGLVIGWIAILSFVLACIVKYKPNVLVGA